MNTLILYVLDPDKRDVRERVKKQVTRSLLLAPLNLIEPVGPEKTHSVPSHRREGRPAGKMEQVGTLGGKNHADRFK